jgi:uncharacterized protein YodC (DUF2158 family)
MENKIKIGDVVRLKSGGPVMTVTAIDKNEVTCKWFNDANIIEISYFPEDALKLVK